MPPDVAAHPTDTALRAFASGTAADDQSALVAQHLSTCSNCRRRLAGLSAVDRPQSQMATPSSAVTDPRLAVSPVPDLGDAYVIERELARGGMGVVYLAHNTLMDRREVVKVMNAAVAAEPGFADRFLKEIQAVARLRHPNVVAAYTALRPVGGLALAMEYVDGVDLEKLVRKGGPLGIEQACDFISQAARGLQHAFEKGLVHRDIKPSNLMVETDGGNSVVRVLDFGLAKFKTTSDETGLTRHGQMMGTPAYLAPEQARDSASADIRADIYSLGCTLYYLLAGQPPFAGGLTAILLAHMSDTPPRVGPAPDELWDVIDRMMMKSPADRYQTPADVVTALRPFLTAPVAPPLTRTRKPTPAPVPAPPTRTHIPDLVPAPPTRTRAPAPAPVPAPPARPVRVATPVARAIRPVMPAPSDDFPLLRSLSSRRRRRGWSPWWLTGAATAIAIVAFTIWALRGTPASPDPTAKSPVADLTPVKPATPPVVAPKEPDPPDTDQKTPPPLEIGKKNPFKEPDAADDNPPPKVVPPKPPAVEDPDKRARERDWIEYRQAFQHTGNTIPFLKANAARRIASWKRAADQNDPAGLVLYADCLLEGEPDAATKDLPQAVVLFRKAADGGETLGMVSLGMYYQNQKYAGGDKDGTEALRWYRKAADAGDPLGMTFLGDCYENGVGVERDLTEAAQWFRKGANGGSGLGMLRIAECYYGGNGIEKDQFEATRWYRKAGDAGNPTAMNKLGVCYEDGTGIEKNVTEAFAWYSKAADLDYPWGMYNLGTCLQNGLGTEKDEYKAARLYRKAADVGNSSAMNRLGLCYSKGSGVEKDAVEAVRWYRKAADLDYSWAMYNLGLCYAEGNGVEKDAYEAVLWYRKAAAIGNPSAMDLLGDCYANGSGVEKDREEAIKWYRKAAALGNEDAKKSLKLLGED